MTANQPAPTRAELLDPLRERRSLRSYDADHVLSDADLLVLLEAARWAPSAGNSQPWAFIVGRRGDATHARIVELLTRGNLTWAPAASALVISLHQAASDESEDALLYSDYAMYDLGQSVAQLTVQAVSMGLAVHQFAGFDHDGVASSFAVPRHWRVTTGIAIGRPIPDDDPGEERDRRGRSRKPLVEFVFGEGFGRPADIASVS